MATDVSWQTLGGMARRNYRCLAAERRRTSDEKHPLSVEWPERPIKFLRACVCACVRAPRPLGCVCGGVLLRHQETLLRTEFIDAAGPGESGSVLVNFRLTWASLRVCVYLSPT